ncbi:hypothetical protein BFW38_05050 [Terasakiispira papahanaumokuakeensis]|uniref:Uncharacterized protein n=1 Tax=Terasakiispira papahanaumokuakeensis TaxID=197479 RepID=A0A1E2V7L7_9GAMM|nr:hypothetical protein BFW38_05050 [Terasakiispira papahanaumokuakeensis]
MHHKIRQPANAHLAVSGDGWHSDRRCADYGHQVRPAGRRDRYGDGADLCTATGKLLLIPQGSRILGKYNSQVSYSQSRVQEVWNRITLPDTSTLTLDNLIGTDLAGYAGLEDDVDWHWDLIFAGAHHREP